MNIKKFESGTICEKTLSNGMKLVIVPNAARPRVLVQMLYDVGSSAEEASETGLAHLLEHMIFKGTPSLQEGAISKLAARYGANLNAFTGHDITAYFFEVDSNNWKPFLAILADCMENVLLSSEHLASEVKAVIQELRMRNDMPSATFFDVLFERCLPEDHPYYHPLIGYKKDLAAMTSERLKAFYAKHYVPERATLFVVGDVNPEDVLAEVERTFAHVPASGKIAAPAFTKEYTKTTGFNLVLPKHWVNPTTGVVWSLPAGFDETADVAQMVGLLLADGPESVLHKRMIDQDQCADNLTSGILRLGNEAFLLISFQPRDGREADCNRAVAEEISKLALNGVDAKVLARRIKQTLVKHEMAQENPTMGLLSYDILNRYAKTGSIDAIFDVAQRFSAVTSDKIKEFVAANLKIEDKIQIDFVKMNDEQKEAWKLDQIKDQELEQQILAAHVRTMPIPENIEFPEKYSQALQITVPVPASSARFELENGLKIVVASEKYTNLCAFSFGSVAQETSQDALVQLKEMLVRNLFIEGAAGQTKDEIISWFGDRGVQYNLSYGYTLCLKEDFYDVLNKYFEIIKAPDFITKNTLFNKVFGSLNASQEAFVKVKNQMIQQYKSMYDIPQGVAGFEYVSRVFKNSPYGYSLEETIQALNALQFSELKESYKQFMNPSQRFLSVAGNLDPQEVFKAVQSAMGDLVALTPVKTLPRVEALPIESFDVSMNRDQVLLQYVRESNLSSSEVSLDRVAVDVLSSLFFGGMTSRIFKLREATGICYACNGALASPVETGCYKSRDMVFALVSPEKLEEACVLFESFIQNVFKSSISQQELDDARHALRSRIANSALGSAALALHFTTLEFYGRKETYRKEYLEFLDQLTPQILEEVSARYFAQGSFVRVRVGNILKSA